LSRIDLDHRAQGIAFQPPVDIGDLTQVNCNDCHSLGSGPQGQFPTWEVARQASVHS